MENSIAKDTFVNGLAASAPGIAGGIISGGLNAIYSAALAKRNYKYSVKLANKQNEMNIANWHMQNEYNSPAAQMQRFADAGLNPNLVYGQGTNGNAGAPQPAAVGHYQQDAAKIELAGAYSQIMHSLAETKLTRAKAKLLEQQTFGQSVNNGIYDVRLKMEEMRYDALLAYTTDEQYLRERGWSQEYINGIKKSGFYKDLENKHVSLETARQRLELYKQQHSINQFQLDNQSSLDELADFVDGLGNVPQFLKALFRLGTRKYLYGYGK